ncbi:MAG: PDZ domain-containing protein [Armatimonadetes bacterium]|nr:PDZ domain-containing protein [Armatimonadota bacterium]
MLSSAASAFVVLLAGLSQSQSTASRLPAWTSVQSSIAYIQDGTRVSGVAALIDDSGLFLVHKSAIRGTLVKARFTDGMTLNLLVLKSDEYTQLALLQATYWEIGVRKPLRVAKSPVTGDVGILAATPAGPRLGEFIADGRAGMMKPSLRYFPLSEIRVEASDDRIAGSLVFNSAGELIGVFGATLETSKRSVQTVGKLRSGLAAGRGGGGGFSAPGPRGVTVAYALGREVLERVVNGFRSPSHKVQHPTIGIFFKATLTGRGVLIESVLAGSPSAIAGLMRGDVVLDIDGESVNSPVELAILLFKQRIGNTIRLRYLRGVQTGTATVTVVGSQPTLGL